MKLKYIFALWLPLFFVLTSGCTLTKDFMVNLEREFSVNENGTAYAKTADAKASDYSSDFDKFKDDLKKLEVVSATYTITFHQGSTTQKVNSATLMIGATDGSTPELLCSLNNVVFSSNVGIEQEFDVPKEGENKVEDLALNDPYSFRYYFSGSVNESPLNFRVKFKLRCKVTYEKKIL